MLEVLRGEGMWEEYELALPQAMRDLLKRIIRQIHVERGCFALELDAGRLCEALVGRAALPRLHAATIPMCPRSAVSCRLHSWRQTSSMTSWRVGSPSI